MADLHMFESQGTGTLQLVFLRDLSTSSSPCSVGNPQALRDWIVSTIESDNPNESPHGSLCRALGGGGWHSLDRASICPPEIRKAGTGTQEHGGRSINNFEDFVQRTSTRVHSAV